MSRGSLLTRFLSPSRVTSLVKRSRSVPKMDRRSRPPLPAPFPGLLRVLSSRRAANSSNRWPRFPNSSLKAIARSRLMGRFSYSKFLCDYSCLRVFVSSWWLYHEGAKTRRTTNAVSMSGGRLTLPERGGRVEHDRDRRRFAAPGHDVDQKVLPVSCNGVIDAPRPGRHANLEQDLGRGCLQRPSFANPHGHQLAARRHVEDLPRVAAPPRPAAAVAGHLEFERPRSRGPERLRVHL